ncbi:hypothetical protein L3476_20555 [Paenibacillus thiaminolyticus]|uniref:hypothetical protein n=1 Tax=Paenibacillus thiaminolyticus TaxID=49283 RepID=UPI00116280B4|nr:hypothetical protein [Paenibacillus thiaminolyticus]MDG0873007.1 hypothetical protein [Paenibacillus thiaminolyticus]NGP60693.1 hypothetical protein [Paenibacillus thiaminolyticus]WCR25687.1 hypothetical protein L3476_20555 [Paenibacillus thiaminolyticus]
MGKAAIPYIVLAIMVGATLFLHVIGSDKIIKEIAFSSIILYLCIFILALRKKDSSKQHDSRIRILIVFILGINFFISIFSGNERFKDIVLGCSFFFVAIFVIMHLARKK